MNRKFLLMLFLVVSGLARAEGGNSFNPANFSCNTFDGLTFADVSCALTSGNSYSLSINLPGSETPENVQGTGSINAQGGEVDFSGGTLKVRQIASSPDVIGRLQMTGGQPIDM